MDKPTSIMAQQIARAAISFQRERTGHAPRSATVVLSGDTLVVTLYEALSPAEKSLASTAEGAAKVQEFHRQLFAASAEPLREEIKRITGVPVREAAADVETTSGTVIQAFTSGTMVQVFLLTGNAGIGSWDGSISPSPVAPEPLTPPAGVHGANGVARS